MAVASDSDVAIVYSSEPALDAVQSVLSGYFSPDTVSIEQRNGEKPVSFPVNIFCVSLSDSSKFEVIKETVAAIEGESIFVLPTHNGKGISRLRQITESPYYVMPLDAANFRKGVKSALNRNVERSWSHLEATKQKALTSAVAAFGNCFREVAEGRPIPVDDMKESCQDICAAAELGGLEDWLQALDNHHDYSFRHSMFVCGTLTYFARSLGIRGIDLEQLTLGGLLHDVGKSQVPLEILDKPGKLDKSEWEIMKRHPEFSRGIMSRQTNLEADTVAMAVHHHEKLDGSGYPDGLKQGQINDHVRLTAIADVYSALIDKRSYKGSMSPEAALDMMNDFKGHLDMDLLRAFRDFTLGGG